jgi:hypothetical protein
MSGTGVTGKVQRKVPRRTRGSAAAGRSAAYARIKTRSAGARGRSPSCFAASDETTEVVDQRGRIRAGGVRRRWGM